MHQSPRTTRLSLEKTILDAIELALRHEDHVTALELLTILRGVGPAAAVANARAANDPGSVRISSSCR